MIIVVAITAVLYNKRLGTFEEPPNPLAQRFYQSVCSMFEKTGYLMFVPPYYKYFNTKTWQEYCQHWDTMFEIAGQLVVEGRHKLQHSIQNNREEMEFLPYVLSRGELSTE